MRILTADQVRQWDQFTIANEPISSIDLMERAAAACTYWIEEHTGGLKKRFYVFCGKGNNGGDGLAIARMLSHHGHDVTVLILEFGHKGTSDFQANLERLHQVNGADIRFIQDETHFPPLEPPAIIIDALFGTGLNRALEAVTAKLVGHINKSGLPVISIDIPSGLFTDKSSKECPVVNATHTLTFQCYKPAFLYAENASRIGETHVLDIGLSADFRIESPLNWVDDTMAAQIYRPRPVFAHKGNFGHALLLAGSVGKMGAAVLAARACLAAGSGLLTVCVPSIGYEIIQAAVPEAMAITSGGEFLETCPAAVDKFRSIGVGPGIDTKDSVRQCLDALLKVTTLPIVADADALNILSVSPEIFSRIPPMSIITPHPKEFERLFGECANDFERTEFAKKEAAKKNLIIILKGHHTLVAMPGGQLYFNSTGNAGMAKGGSGDVLTGFITGLLASGYAPEEASVLGVFLHGLAGDIAAGTRSMETMTASDLIDALPLAFRQVADLATAEKTIH